MLAVVQFAAPALLAGMVGAALPFVIHLLLRPRPRRVRFPPVTFLYSVLASGQRAQRWRNLWLLLVRALLLACVALLLAGPTCAPALAPGPDEPVACVLVLDDSWSMQYTLDSGATTFDRARAAALEIVRAAAKWPQPSALGLVWADPDRPAAELTTDHKAVRTQLSRHGGEHGPLARRWHPHARPLGDALRRAATLLQAARQPNRRLVVITDQAAHAWRDVPPGLLTGVDNLSVQVRSVSLGRRSNIALTACSGPAGLHPEGSPLPIEATLTAAGLDATCFLVVRDMERVLERIGPLEVRAGSSRDVSHLLPPRSRGVHALVLTVEPTDRLGLDQSRYVVFQTAERPTTWLVTPADAGPDTDLTALLLRNLLAPETLAEHQQLVTCRHLLPNELAQLAREDAGASGPEQTRVPDRSGDRSPNLVVVVGGVELNEAARQAVRRQAERGATVLLLPGSREDATDWPGLRRRLARTVLRVETLDSVTSLSWESASAFAGRSEELDELTRTAIRRRVVLAGLEAGVTVEARYADGMPAILSQRWGRGRFIVLTTSPDPQWSELGVRAAGLLTWLHALLQEALGSPDAIAMFTAGQATRYSFPGLPGRGIARVASLTDEDRGPLTRRLSNGEPTEDWPTERPGIYQVRTSHPEVREMLYAVNWPAEESDLQPIAKDRLAALLGVADVDLRSEGGAVDERAATPLSRLLALRDAARALPFVLLALVLGELILANRARRAAGP